MDIEGAGYGKGFRGIPACPHPPLYAIKKCLRMIADLAIIASMNRTHRKTLETLFSTPVNGNLEWRKIEALLVALGAKVIEGEGSHVTFFLNGKRADFHRPHPGKEALRYRVKAAHEFLEQAGVKP